MAERASHATKPSESDFRDSHPLDDDLTPSLGDLTDIDSLPDIKSSKAQQIGDMSAVAKADGDVDDVLGDITLLEEAFAEMDEDQPASVQESDEDRRIDIASKLASNIAEEELPELEDIEIPVLNETVDEPTSNSEPASTIKDINQSIPLLEQEATAFAAAKSSKVSMAIDTALEHLLDDEHPVKQVEPEVPNDVSVFVEPDEEAELGVSQFEPIVTNFAEVTADSGIQTSVDALSELDIEDVNDGDVIRETVDDKIAQLAAEHQSVVIDEQTLSKPVRKSPKTEIAEDPYSDLPTDFAEELNTAPQSRMTSRFDSNQAVSQPSHTEHQVSVGQNSSFSINIPFELHTQLSKKIDELVIDATTSLTNELHGHLNDRLDILLQQSVEAVLPKLVDQMLNGLRKEVKQRVKQQLPVIINEVLGKTSLKDK